jgi:hypothetical protein
MYLVGIFHSSKPKEIINPVHCRNLLELQSWLTKNYEGKDFIGNPPLTLMSIMNSLHSDIPVRLNFIGLGAYYGIIYGSKTAIHQMDIRHQ